MFSEIGKLSPRKKILLLEPESVFKDFQKITCLDILTETVDLLIEELY